LKDQIQETLPTLTEKKRAYFDMFKDNLTAGISYYQDLVPKLKKESVQYRLIMNKELDALKEELNQVTLLYQSQDQLAVAL